MEYSPCQAEASGIRGMSADSWMWLKREKVLYFGEEVHHGQLEIYSRRGSRVSV